MDPVGEKSSLNRYLKFKITPCIFSEYHILKQDINKKRQQKVYTQRKLDNSLLDE